MEKLFPKPVSKHDMEEILNQMNNSICFINKKEGNFELGFFIYFKRRNKRILL